MPNELALAIALDPNVTTCAVDEDEALAIELAVRDFCRDNLIDFESLSADEFDVFAAMVAETYLELYLDLDLEG